jgi:hypothetical protein
VGTGTIDLAGAGAAVTYGFCYQQGADPVTPIAGSTRSATVTGPVVLPVAGRHSVAAAAACQIGPCVLTPGADLTTTGAIGWGMVIQAP